MRGIVAAAALLIGAGAANSARAPELVDVRSIDPTIRVRLSYARKQNAFGRQFYSGDVALLRKPVAERLARAQRRLKRKDRGLMVWDAYRPKSVQRQLWKSAPHGRSRYIANPSKISKHSRGAAVDVTLVNLAGAPEEMPTGHDEFSPRAHRDAVRGIGRRARSNRALLIQAMRAEGFLANPYEWWHFTAPEWSRYPASDEPVPRSEPR